MLPLRRHLRVGPLAVGPCLVGLLLCCAAGPARGQPVPLKEELTAQERQKLEQQAAALARQGNQRYQEGRLDDAVQLWARVVEIRRRVYSPDRFPDGHPDLAASLNNLGELLQARGDLARAEPLLRDALAMRRKLYPSARFPDSHPDLAESLSTLGALLQARGELAHAEPLLRDALAMNRKLYPPACYPDGHPDLASLLRPGADLRPGQADRVRELSDRKENLEKQLADKLPLYQALQERLKRGPADLVPLLPPGAVFCDLTRYLQFDHDSQVPGAKSERWTLCYVAFVLARGQPVRRVELGAAEPIDAALAAWRRSLQAGKASSPAAATLRRRLWQPLEHVFPAQTCTVLVAPDAALTGLPWAALPGRRADTVLLEEYALATMPNGQFLLDLLHAPAHTKEGPGLLLAAGGIDYEGTVEPVRLAAAQGLARAPAKAKDAALWTALPGTRQELAQLRRLAGKRPVVELEGVTAGTGRLLADLPRARWAHLATHGFFADPSVRSLLQLTPQDYQRSQRGERVGLGARSPLVLSGLVCAGADRPVQDADKEDGGILTAEAIAGLDLDGLELAVLSACDTGLGESGGGEGVFGLQRAFHLAGARSTVASLWKVDDAATQTLMQEFYRNLWERQLPKLEALRRAQVAMLLHYDAKAGKLRAPGTAVAVDPAALAAARQELRTAGRRPLPPLYWAAFVLSGEWR